MVPPYKYIEWDNDNWGPDGQFRYVTVVPSEDDFKRMRREGIDGFHIVLLRKPDGTYHAIKDRAGLITDRYCGAEFWIERGFPLEMFTPMEIARYRLEHRG